MTPRTSKMKVDVDRDRRLGAALDLVSKGHSAREAARLYDVSHSTVVRRRRDAQHPRDHAYQHLQKVSPELEELLASRILEEEVAGRSMSYRDIRQYANLLFKQQGVQDTVGTNWVRSFLRRHNNLTKKNSTTVDSDRLSAELPDKVRDFQKRLHKFLDQYGVKTSNIYNMDETRVQEGETDGQKVIGSTFAKRGFRHKSTVTTWVSIIECISASGRSLRPSVILSGKTLQTPWFDAEFPLWQFSASPKGWNSSEHAVQWLEGNFLPSTRPATPSEWRLLILDQHCSHLSIEFMWKCYEGNVRALYLPARSSHVMQPLDVTVFGPLKTYYHQETAAFASLPASSPIDKQRFLRAYEVAREKAFSEKNVRSGFKATGICPLNDNRPFEQEWFQNLQKRQKEKPITSGSNPQSTPLLTTPKRGTDLRLLGEMLLNQAESFNLLLDKGCKAIDKQAELLVAQSREIERLKEEMRALKPPPRAAIVLNPNDLFVEAPRIHAAQVEAQRKADIYEATHRAETKATALMMARLDQKDCEFQWQL